MNRELKFRAWDKKEKIMHSHVQDWYDNVTQEKDEPYQSEQSFGDILDNPERYIVMQFTGLKDKNGKEIYEGDILGYSQEENKNIQTEFGRASVHFGEYDDENWEYGRSAIGWYCVGFEAYRRIGGKIDRYWFDSKSLLEIPHWEVIGGIYQNPELLKETQNERK